MFVIIFSKRMSQAPNGNDNPISAPGTCGPATAPFPRQTARKSAARVPGSGRFPPLNLDDLAYVSAFADQLYRY